MYGIKKDMGGGDAVTHHVTVGKLDASADLKFNETNNTYNKHYEHVAEI